MDISYRAPTRSADEDDVSWVHAVYINLGAIVMSSSLCVVIPAWNAGGHLSATLETVLAARNSLGLVQVVVVDDFSVDRTADRAFETLSRCDEVKFTVVELARNVGQSAATAIGLSYATADFVVTIDDDLAYPLESVPSLLHSMSESTDFVVGSPETYANSIFRSVASRLVRWLAVRALDAPKGFVFSSLVMYRRSFIERLNLRELAVDEVGWMFLQTKRYSNVGVKVTQGIRGHSTYRLGSLITAARPLLKPVVSVSARALRFLALTLSALTLSMSGLYVAIQVSGSKLLPGFPTIAVLLLLNTSLLGVLLSQSISSYLEIQKSRKPEVFQLIFRTRTN